jgi:alpha-N-arabinofuranosidase
MNKASPKLASMAVSRDSVISDIDKRIYGSFIEHMGRAIYTGIYEPGHPKADAEGFRTDVLEFVKDLNIPLIRYPGGNFVSGYRWEDGIGPRESRKKRLDLAWFTIEPNAIGLNEFSSWLTKAGAEMMQAVNLGTRGAQEAQDLIEYCNYPSGTYWSDLRISHGHTEPYGVKLWCLGNEMDGPWQICGKTADEYGRLAYETAKVMKWVDPGIELVACGSSNAYMPTYKTWEETVLGYTYEYADYLSLHSYYRNDDGDTPSFLASGMEMDRLIKEVAGICERVRISKKSAKKLYLSFDEWNVWYHCHNDKIEVPKWVQPRPIEEEQYNFEDALVVGSLINSLINNADVVKIACLAQLVNTLAPIATVPGGSTFRHTTYYPFLYASRFGRGKALRADLECPAYSCRTFEKVPYVDAAVVLNENEGEIVFYLVNRSIEDDMEFRCALGGLKPRDVLEWVSMEGYGLKAGNTASAPLSVIPRERTGARLAGGQVAVNLSKASWNMIRIKLN